MVLDPDKLVVFVEEKTGEPSCGPVPLPTPSDVCYEPCHQPLVSLKARAPFNGTKPLGTKPRVTGSVGKRCDNCRLFAEREDRCLIIGREVVVLPNYVCSYHVDGEPQLYVTALSGTPYLTAELAGLLTEPPPRGTTCDACTYYEPQTDDGGTCRAVATPDGELAQVDALGCCARWRPKDDPELPSAP